MKKSKYLLLASSLGAAVAGAAFAPGVAQAGQCCPGNWSNQVANVNDQAQCNVAVGGGRVDGNILVLTGDHDVLYGFTSSEAYSPAIRHRVQCTGGGAVNLGDWVDHLNSFGCGTAGIQWAQCRTRLADGFFCGFSCGNEDF